MSMKAATNVADSPGRPQGRFFDDRENRTWVVTPALHWLAVLTVVTTYVTSGNPAKTKDVFDVLMWQVHVISGLAAFALVTLRIRFVNACS